MCQHVVFLAERDGIRYVSQCEHGTVHLVWDAVGFHLPAAAFLQIAYRILETAALFDAQPEPSARKHCLLQVGRITVTLQAEDFLPLAEMVAEALPSVAITKPTAQWQAPRLIFPHQPTVSVFN